MAELKRTKLVRLSDTIYADSSGAKIIGNLTINGGGLSSSNWVYTPTVYATEIDATNIAAQLVSTPRITSNSIERTAGGAHQLLLADGTVSLALELFAVVGTNALKSSGNGRVWTTRTLPAGSYWLPFSSVTYGNGLFVAVASGTATAASSTDGITWTLGSGSGGSAIAVATLSTYSREGLLKEVFTGTAYAVGQYDKWVNLATSAACTVTLPSAGTNKDRELVLKQTGAFAVSSSTSNVKPLASQTPGTAILSGAGKYAKLVSDGYYWITMEAN